MCFNLRTRDIKGNSFLSDDIYTCELQTYFTQNTVLIAIFFKVSSVCIILLTFITVTGYCGCLIYTTEQQYISIILHQKALSPSEDSSFHVQTDLEIQIVLLLTTTTTEFGRSVCLTHGC